jgi:hypothetical protein
MHGMPSQRLNAQQDRSHVVGYGTAGGRSHVDPYLYQRDYKAETPPQVGIGGGCGINNGRAVAARDGVGRCNRGFNRAVRVDLRGPA